MTDEFNAIYDILGYNNGKHLFDAQGKISVNGEKGCVEVVLHAQGTTPVRYTLDGITGKGRPGFVFVDEILVN